MDRSEDVLPRLLLVADRFTSPEISAVLPRIVSRGSVRWVQLRDHKACRALFRGRGEVLAGQLRRVADNLCVSVNTDLEFARNLEAGLHLGVRGPSVAEARERLGEDVLVGYSAHDREEAVRAAEEGADYITFSPIFPTASKPGHPGVGVDVLGELCRELEELPVYALGGVTPGRVVACREAGAYGAAVLSGILSADDPVEAAAAYEEAFHEVTTTRVQTADN